MIDYEPKKASVDYDEPATAGGQPAAGCWVRVEDRLPGVGEHVLCWPPKAFDGRYAVYTVVLRRYGFKQWFVVEGNGVVYNHNPTHWAPMPEPPNARSEARAKQKPKGA